MLRALGLAVTDLGDRRILAILAKSLIVTLALFAGLALLLGWALRGADPCDWLGVGGCALDGVEGGVGALVLTGLALWLLFPAVALGVVAAFTDDVVAAVEARHYPADLATARRLGLAGGAMVGLRGSLRLLLYNLIAAPLYLILLVTGIGTPLLFVAVNGLAMGADLGEMVAARHQDRGRRKAWMRATRGQRALIGVAIAALFLVPIANLLAPVLGAAAMTHFYHASRRGRGLG